MVLSPVGIARLSSSRSGREAARLAEVRRFGILDTPPDGAFDRIAALAAQLLNVPIAIVSVVDVDRIWFKSHHGLDATQVNRDPGLCASAILQDEPWIIENAAIDPRALTNPLVAGQLGLRSYAGAQLRTRDGYNLGMLCVLDRKPRKFSPAQVGILETLAEVVVRELEVRLAARRAVLAMAPELDCVPDDESRASALTQRERAVLETLSEGLSNREIALRLSITQATVKSHVSNVYGKLDLRNRAAAAAFAVRNEE